MSAPHGGTIVLDIAKLVMDGGQLARPRHQNPKVEKSTGENPFWFIRPYVDVLDGGSIVRKKKRIPIGTCDLLGKRDAQTRANKIMETINQTDYVVKQQLRLNDFLPLYRKSHMERLGVAAQDKYESLLKNWIVPVFGDSMLCEITTLRVQQWLDSIKRSWNTRTDIRNVLSSIFTKAREWKHWQDENPIEPVSAGRKRLVREKRKLTDDQTRLLLAALPLDVRILCCACLFSALRVSEALGLQEKHLDFETGQIHVRQRYRRGNLDQTKTEKSERDVPMGYLSDDLRRMCRDDPERFVFQIETHPNWGRDKGICRDDRDLNQHFLRKSAKALGFYWKGFGFHSLRREAITSAGSIIGIGQAMNLAGHSKVDMSLMYTLRDQSEQERAVRAHQERILGSVAGKVM